MSTSNKNISDFFNDNATKINTAGAGLSSIFSLAKDNATIEDTDAIEADINNKKQSVYGLNDNKSLLSNYRNYNLSDIDYKDLMSDNIASNTLSSTIAGATAGGSVGGIWGAVIGGIAGLGSGLIGGAVGKSRAKEEAERLNSQISSLKQSYVDQINRVDKRNDMRILANIQKYGGPLLSPQYRLQNFFAKGGPLATNGDIYSNGVTQINEGGSHAENPYQGVQIGMDNQGVPNLLEEGEVIWNDYVFSAKLKPTKEMKKKNKYKGETFAAVAKNLQKESEERPYDPISQRGLESSMNILAAYQEMVRGEKERRDKQSKGIQQAIQGMSVDDIQQMLTGMPQQEQSMSQEMPMQDELLQEGVNMYEKGTEDLETQDLETQDLETKLKNAKPKYEAEPVFSLKNAAQYNYAPWLTDDFRVPWYDNPIEKVATPQTPPLNVDALSLDDINTSALKSMKNIKYPGPTKAQQKILDALEKAEQGENEGKSSFLKDASWARYAPVVGSGLQVLSDALGVTNKADYTNTEFIQNAANNLRAIEYTPVGNYLTYKPFDRNYYSNKQAAQANATRRAIMNMSNSNRAQALAGLLAADYNAQTKLGDLYRQEAEYNDKQRQVVTQFNNAVNLQNAQMSMQAQQANAEQDRARLNAAMQIANMRENIDSAVSASKSTNLSNFISNLGKLGQNSVNRNDAQWVFEKIYMDDTLTPEQKDALAKLYRKANNKEDNK